MVGSSNLWTDYGDLFWSRIVKPKTCAMADPGFPGGGTSLVLEVKNIIWQEFWRKLHKNERSWPLTGLHIPRIRQCWGLRTSQRPPRPPRPSRKSWTRNIAETGVCSYYMDQSTSRDLAGFLIQSLKRNRTLHLWLQTALPARRSAGRVHSPGIKTPGLISPVALIHAARVERRAVRIGCSSRRMYAL